MLQHTHVLTVALPKTMQAMVEGYIGEELHDMNPYSASPALAEKAAGKLWTMFASHPARTAEEEQSLTEFRKLVALANSDKDVPPILLKNCAREPQKSSVQPDETRGFNYSGSQKDRMKRYFFTEWSSWLFAILLNHENTIHPSEHGGNNRFHLVSPISMFDKTLRDVGASTGGGKFQQHSDATAYNEFPDRMTFLSELDRLGADITSIEGKLQLSSEHIYEQIFCGKYVRVDATVLAGIYNKDTVTHVMTPRMLQDALKTLGYGHAELSQLAGMAVAHMAGPADGEISGYLGTITSPLRLDPDGNIQATCLNLADGRMKYVGKSDDERALFARFVEDARWAPVEEVLVEASDILFLPNASYKSQANVTHGRGALTDSDYAIEIEPSVTVRRAHCRQYLTSRRRDDKPSFLDALRH